MMVKVPSPRIVAANAPGLWMSNTMMGMRFSGRREVRGGSHLWGARPKYTNVLRRFEPFPTRMFGGPRGEAPAALGPLEQATPPLSGGARPPRRIGRKKRVAGSRRKYDH